MGFLGYIAHKAVASGKEAIAEAELKRHYELLQQNWDSILEEFSKGVGVDEVARRYKAEHQIPETRTILYLCSFIRELAMGEDVSQQHIARVMAATQFIDGTLGPKEDIGQFNFADRVFSYLGCNGYYKKNDFAAANGVFILSKAFVYFFEISDEALARKQESGTWSGIKNRAMDGVEDAIPGLSYFSAGWDVISGAKDAVKDYFDAERKKILMNLFDTRKLFCQPLSRLHSVDCFTDKKGNNYLQLAFGSGEKDFQLFVIPNEKPEDFGVWVQQWKELICTAAVGEGKLLI